MIGLYHYLTGVQQDGYCVDSVIGLGASGLAKCTKAIAQQLFWCKLDIYVNALNAPFHRHQYLSQPTCVVTLRANYGIAVLARLETCRRFEGMT